MADDRADDDDRAVATEDRAELLERAREARSLAIAPYSAFPVGAAVRTADGEVYEGANLEVVNFSNTLHAEEVALARALVAGHRDFDAIAVAGPDADGLAPCGRCRQTLAEFCPADLPVVVDDGGEPRTYTLDELLPDRMSAERLRDR